MSELDLLVKINDINHDLLNIKHDKLYLNTKPLKFQSTILTCPLGIEVCKDGEETITKLFIAEKDVKIYQELDNCILNLNLKCNPKFKFTSFLNLNSSTGEFYLNLKLKLSSTVFYDGDKTKLSNDAPILSSNFKAYFLLDLSNINYTEENVNLNLQALQVRLKSQNVLPKGCFIYTDYEELKKFLEKDEEKIASSSDESALALPLTLTLTLPLPLTLPLTEVNELLS